MITEVNFNRSLRDINISKSIKGCEPTGCTTLEQQYNLFSKVYPYYIKKGVEVCAHNLKELDEIFRNALEVSQTMLFQTEFTFSIEKNDTYETKNFSLFKEKKTLVDFPELYYPVSIIINELLVRPHLVEFHVSTLVLLRRLYYYFPHLRPRLVNPLMILFTNISLLGTDEAKKQAAVFLYQLINKENDENINQIFSTPASETQPSRSNHYLDDYKKLLSPITSNKVFGVQALAYPADVDIVIDSKCPKLSIGYPLFKKVESGAFFTINCVVRAPLLKVSRS